jgi:2-oxoglutarate dehydrogenase E2 component (dihydrolipoamide succinyltransferase)
MAKYKLLLPKMGESVAEATIIKWVKNPGDHIETDETVMEIATDKVDSDVPSPVSGKLVEQLYKDNDVVQVGSVIAIIETDEPGELKDNIQAAPVFQQVREEPALEPSGESKTAGVEPQPESAEGDRVTGPASERPDANEAEIFTTHTDEPAEKVPYTEQLEERAANKHEASYQSSSRFYSPLVKNIAAQEGISNTELDKIAGTGAEGRLTKDDLLSYIQKRYEPVPDETAPSAEVPKESVVSPDDETSPVSTIETPGSEVEPSYPAPETETTIQEPVIEETSATAAEPGPIAGAPQPEPVKQEVAEDKIPAGKSVSGGDEIIEMDRMRRLIADHMVMSKHTSPHVTSFVEADVTNLVQWRERIKNSFEKREGEKITFTPIFIEAVVKAIKDFPMINISVNGTQIIKKKDINISMATALPNGNLIVPVVKKADELSLLGITKAVNDLANRARINKLKPDDVQGGTFTITNVGSFGNVMGTPIINQPQVAILAVGAIRKKPAVIETEQGDMIGIRHLMFLSLSYDHRVVDGALGGSFVRRVADYLENWDKNRVI